MKNFIQPGDTLSLTAPYTLLSGDGFLVGSLFAVASADAANGAAVEGATTGVFELKKTNAQAWTAGALIYWDNAAKECTTVPTSNKLIGVAAEAASNPTAKGRVRLNSAFIS